MKQALRYTVLWGILILLVGNVQADRMGTLSFASYPRSPDLYLIDSTGKNFRKLTTDHINKGTPTWSPDGTMLAYTKYPYDDIHIVPATGGDSRQITNTPKQQESELIWTPDGKRIAYKVHGVEWWIVSIDGGKPTKLHRNHIPSSWSSDGTSYLALAPHGELLRISLDGTILSELSVRAPMHAQPLSISPDGETILIWHVDSEKSCWGIDVSHLDGL